MRGSGSVVGEVVGDAGRALTGVTGSVRRAGTALVVMRGVVKGGAAVVGAGRWLAVLAGASGRSASGVLSMARNAVDLVSRSSRSTPALVRSDDGFMRRSARSAPALLARSNDRLMSRSPRPASVLRGGTLAAEEPRDPHRDAVIRVDSRDGPHARNVPAVALC